MTDISHLPLLGSPPQDRPLRDGEQFPWAGEHYRVEHSHRSVFSIYKVGFPCSTYIGEAKTLFDLEKLLGIPSAKPLQSADTPPAKRDRGGWR